MKESFKFKKLNKIEFRSLIINNQMKRYFIREEKLKFIRILREKKKEK